MRVHDTEFGEITLAPRVSAERAEVTGDAIPRVVFRRLPRRGWRRRRVLLFLDDRPLRVRRRRRPLRRLRGVTVRCGGVRYRLSPVSSDTSRLRAGRRRLCDFTVLGEFIEPARWRDPTRVKIHAQDAALGYALAAATGTGGTTFWEWLDGLDLLP